MEQHQFLLNFRVLTLLRFIGLVFVIIVLIGRVARCTGSSL
jgi:hypothetical protein